MKKTLTIIEIFNLALQNYQNKDYQSAIDLYSEVLKIEPNHVVTHSNLGTLFKELGNYQKAIECFEKITKIDPSYIRAYNNLGAIFQLLGEHQKSKKCFEKVIKIDPNHLSAHNNLGVIFQNLNEYSKAENCFQKAIEINPNYLNAHNNLGALFQALGDYQKAIDCYQKSISLKPDDQVSRYSLGVMFHTIKQYENAAEQFKLINFKKSKSFLLSCLYKLNDKPTFFRELDNAIKQGEVNATIGSLSSCSEVKYGIQRLNPFCKDPLKYVLKVNLAERYDFKNIFAKHIKNILKEDILSSRKQGLLTNGHQTAGNLFAKKNVFLDKIKNIINSEVENYQNHFKESEEGLIKSWPNSYSISAWLVSMKSGGKLKPHIHDYGWLSGSIYINVPPKLKTDSGNLVVCIDDQESEMETNINKKK